MGQGDNYSYLSPHHTPRGSTEGTPARKWLPITSKPHLLLTEKYWLRQQLVDEAIAQSERYARVSPTRSRPPTLCRNLGSVA